MKIRFLDSRHEEKVKVSGENGTGYINMVD